MEFEIRIRDSGIRIWNPENDSGFRIRGPGFEIQDLGFGIRDSTSRIQDLEFESCDLGFGIQDLVSGI